MSPTVDQPAAEREPDNVTPCWACNGSGTQVVGDELETEVFECAVCSGTGLPKSDLMPELLDWSAYEACPSCWAQTGDPCVILGGYNPSTPHPDRQLKPVEPERRTVSLELATDELRELAVRLARSNIREEMAAAKVVVVLRFGGQPVAVPDTDVPWATGAAGDPVKALRGLLSEMIRGKNQLERDEGTTVELLMPGADVLAALDGRPDAQLLTAPVWVLAMDIEQGMLLAPLDSFELHRVTGPPVACGVADCKEGASCVVVLFEGGRQHQSGYARTRVRVPASVTL